MPVVLHRFAPSQRYHLTRRPKPKTVVLMLVGFMDNMEMVTFWRSPSMPKDVELHVAVAVIRHERWVVDEGVTTHLIFSKVAFERVDECIFQSYKILTENWRHVKVGSPIKRISDLVSIGYSRDNALCVIMIRYAQVICRLVLMLCVWFHCISKRYWSPLSST